MKCLVGSALIALVCMSLVGEQPVYAGQRIRFATFKVGKPVPLQEKEISWHKPTRSQAQTWSLWGWNDKGYMVTVFLISTRFLMVSRLGVQLTIYTPKGKVIHHVKEYTLSHVKGKAKRIYLKVAGKHWWDGFLKKGTVHVDYGISGCHLTYRRTLSGYRHMKGPMRMGRGVFEGLIFAPRVSLAGSLRVDGKKILFQGVGYADYTLQTITPKNLAKRWYATRAVGKEYTVLTHHLLTIKQWKPMSLPGLSIARGDRWEFMSLPRHIRYFRAYHMKKDKESGHRVPWRVIYKAEADDGTRYKVDLKHTKQIVRLNLLSHLNPFVRFFIKRLLSSPFVFRFQSTITLEIKHPKQTIIRRKLKAYSEWLFVQ